MTFAVDTSAPRRVDLTVLNGADYGGEVVYTDGLTGAPINISDAAMEIRASSNQESTLLLTPQLSVVNNTAIFTIPGATSETVYAVVGYYDMFATEVSSGQRVKLIYGQVTFTPNVTT